MCLPLGPCKKMTRVSIAVVFVLVYAAYAVPHNKQRDFDEADEAKAIAFCNKNGIPEADCSSGLQQCEDNDRDEHLLDCMEHHMEQGVVFPEIRKAFVMCEVIGIHDRYCMMGIRECFYEDKLDFANCSAFHAEKYGKVDCTGNMCQESAEYLYGEVSELLNFCDANNIPHCDCVHGIRDCVYQEIFDSDVCIAHHSQAPTRRGMPQWNKAKSLEALRLFK